MVQTGEFAASSLIVRQATSNIKEPLGHPGGS